MRKRITISMDEKLIWMLRNKQAEMMLDSNKSVSISTVVCEILLKSINDDKMIKHEIDSAFVNQNQ